MCHLYDSHSFSSPLGPHPAYKDRVLLMRRSIHQLRPPNQEATFGAWVELNAGARDANFETEFTSHHRRLFAS